MIRAYIADNFNAFNVGISLVRTTADESQRWILRLADSGAGQIVLWEDLDPLGDAEPTLRLGQEEARALLDALTTHYGGVDDKRTLRADYLAERERVDKLAAVVAGIAQTLAGSE
jgi:hypothetical protein